MTSSDDERRHFSRIRFDRPAQLVMAADAVDVKVVDLSLKGVLVTMPTANQLDHSQSFKLHISLANDVTIDMVLELAHQNGDQAGFHCTHIDLESMGHLRRLVELNLGDAEALRRELAEMAEEDNS